MHSTVLRYRITNGGYPAFATMALRAGLKRPPSGPSSQIERHCEKSPLQMTVASNSSLYLLQNRKRSSHGRVGNVEKLGKLWSRDGWAEEVALYMVTAVLS